jgi:hypothetical protein
MMYATKEMIEAQRKRLIGKRVRLEYTNDRYTDLRSGDEGVVTFIDDTGTVFVDWDNGSGLGLIESAGDRYSVLSPADAQR